MNGVHSLASLQEGSVSTQTPVYAQPVSFAQQLGRREDKRFPELRPITIKCAGCENADNFMRITIKDGPAMKDVWIAAEIVLPSGMTEDDDRCSAGAILIRCKRAPKLYVRHEHFEVVGGDRFAGKPLRLAFTGKSC